MSFQTNRAILHLFVVAQVPKQDGQRSGTLRVGERRGRFQLHVATVNVGQQRRGRSGEDQEEQGQIRRAGDASKDSYRFRLILPLRAQIQSFPSTQMFRESKTKNKN